MPKTTPLAVDLLRTDCDTQSRSGTNQDAVDDYAEVIANHDAWPFDPLDVFFDDTDYFVGDGFHRLFAAKQVKRASVPCRVHKGTAKDARIFGMTANDRHGLRMTRAEKRANVEWLLDNGGKMTQKAIAEAAGVGKRLVQIVVADRKPSVVPHQTPPVATKAHNAPLQPEEVEDGSWIEVDDPFEEPTNAQNASENAQNASSSGNGKPPKQYDRSYWFKQYDQSIGSVARLVDKIAKEVGEPNSNSHRQVQGHLRNAATVMERWMGVDQ